MTPPPAFSPPPSGLPLQIVNVTDHAVLRYLERAHGLNVADVRRHLSGRAMNGAALGAVGVAVENVKLVLRDGVVVTVLRRGCWSRSDENE